MKRDILGDLAQCLIVALCILFMVIGGKYIYKHSSIGEPPAEYTTCMLNLAKIMKSGINDQLFDLMDSYCQAQIDKK